MRPPIFDAKILRQYLRRHQIATLTDLKRVLDTDVDITVFRKLQMLDYLTSNTHRGNYYTQNEDAHFDDSGLLSHQAVWFSRYRTLLLTVEHFVNHSPRGFFASDLADILHAEVHDALHQLVQQERLQRTEVNGVYLYTAIDPSTHRRQLRAQRTAQSVPVVSDVTTLQVSPDEVKASILLFYGLLNEQQRRLRSEEHTSELQSPCNLVCRLLLEKKKKKTKLQNMSKIEYLLLLEKKKSTNLRNEY